MRMNVTNDDWVLDNCKLYLINSISKGVINMQFKMYFVLTSQITER